ncbi:MAG TPA: ABC transporter permease [Puia sp.]|uniref:ABC transporter permease n=1 Tax=Puia sp. TaxID=2045100 RepID=UPI002BF273A3|nr:ABC transporter permease [Puia sp.]HVU99283.1 ABC transporter permease [Puia sp.]
MLQNYIRVAWRNLTRNRIWAFTNVTGLSIGLAAVMLIMLYVSDEISFDRFQANGPHLYRLVHDSRDETGKEGGGGTTGGPMATAFLQSIPEISAACRIKGTDMQLVRKGSEILPEYATYADTSFFSMFSFPLVSGNPHLALNRENDVVLSEDYARKYFNSTDVVGRTLEINDHGKFETFTVSAVAANTPLNSSIRFNMLLPMKRIMHPQWTQGWMTFFLNTFFLLKPGADPAAVAKKMNGIFAEHIPGQFQEYAKKHPNVYFRYNIQPFEKMHLDNRYNATMGLNKWSNARYSYILGGIAFFILLIACINFVNLTLARSLRRGKEIGIRKVAGGTRRQLIAQFLGESLFLNGLSFLIALTLVRLCLPLFSQLAAKELSVSYLFTGSTLTLFIILLLINSFLSGFYPALVLSGFNPVKTLYGKFRLTGKNRLGKGLIVLQFTIAIFLIVATLVMQQQFRFMLGKDPGFRVAGILNLSLPDGDETKIHAFQAELAKYPAIRQSAVQSIGFNNYNSADMEIDRRDIPGVSFYKMDAQSLSLLQIPLVAGRGFSGTPADSANCLINESMALASGLKDPIGRRVKWDNQEFTVIGIVRDFHMESMHGKIGPCMINQNPHWTYGNMTVLIDNTRKAEAVEAVRAGFKSIYPLSYFDSGFLQDILAEGYDGDKRWMTIVTIAAALAIALSCLGLFGLATLSIEQRLKEIGIRRVLGADILSITRLLSKDFVRLVLLAFVIAAPMAWYFGNKWLEDFAYRIHVSIFLLLIVGAATTLVSFLTVGLRAAAAAKANPSGSLRSE